MTEELKDAAAPDRAWDTDGQRWVYPVDIEEALAQATRAAQLLHGEAWRETLLELIAKCPD